MTTDPPERPTGARIEHRNGEVTPLELVYGGIVEGCHVWRAATPLRTGDRLCVDRLPAHSGIDFVREENRWL
jgi:hypothetical protein